MQCTCINYTDIKNDCTLSGKREHIPEVYLEGKDLLNWLFQITTANVEKVEKYTALPTFPTPMIDNLN